MRNTHTNDNDNDELTFKPLAVAAARVVSKLHKKQDEKGDRNRCSTDEAEKNAVEHRKYVNQRLRDLAAFEDRAKGVKPR